MTIPLRLLILENSIDEIEKIINVLSQAGFAPQWRRIETESDYLAQLNEELDVILASTESQLNMAKALTLLKKSQLNIPFIALGEANTQTLPVSLEQETIDYQLNNQREQLGQIVRQTLQEMQNDQQLEKKRADRTQFDKLLSHLSTYFINLSFTEIDEAINNALQAIGEFFLLDRSYVFQQADSEPILSKTHEWSTNSTAPQTKPLKYFTEYFSEDFELATNLSPEKFPTTAAECSKLAQTLVDQAQTTLIVPIVLERNLVGVVGFDVSHQKACLPTSVPASGNVPGALDSKTFNEYHLGSDTDPCLQRSELINSHTDRKDNSPLPPPLSDRMVMLKTVAELLVSVIKRKRTEESRQRLEKTIRQDKELAQVTLQSIGDAVMTTDWTGRVQYINPVAEKLTGWKTLEAHGRLLGEVFRIIDENSRAPVENPVEEVWRSGQIVKVVNRMVLIARDGTEYAIDISAAPIGIHQGIMIGTVLVFWDNTQSRSLTHQLSWQATHDNLTKLVNRRGFEQDLAKAIASAQHEETQHALCYLDLDQFKVVNDTCGHVAGDELLRQVSVLLRQHIRSTDILARLGGDEFGILLYQCPLYKAEQIVNSLQHLIQKFRFTWDGKSFTIGISIGLVPIDHTSQDLNSLLGAADVACYAAKDKGGNYIQVYRAEDQELARQRGESQWILKIHAALEENRFCLYCQKIAPVTADFKEEHCEVLLRMINEEGALVPPMAFIPAAERYNLMPAIDRWVIRTFFAKYTQYFGEDPRHQPDHVYTINLSGASVNHNQFLDFLKEQFINTPNLATVDLF